ncbi:1-acyl-sn-glycerol-3-phosphate acyltransferase [Bacillus pakistanensis]|uniref:1-acyl-sn-glycerol-3-phosphate acyltransferase n=1 Tax=Rossellomorea pakistanensis TaxID=992288 RepID=A0ABS2N6W3_9BACI|nr:lysophospholipid acyltransferase family protein [Bacillus pakistanensis]MBM7583596.1 1-acyl-sn-glycerol-3-phosphate acyltransferase [Bacillus pakistanensis]
MLYSLLKPAARLIIHLKFRIKITGLEHVPTHSALIIAANHVSNYDPILLSCVIKRKIHFMAKAELFHNRFLKWFFTSINMIPVDRHSGIVIRPVRQGLKVINNGEVFGIFPEGKRCKNGEIVQPKKGVAFIARKTNTPILPIVIIGVKKGFRTPIKIVIGPQINFCHLDISDYSSLSQYVMNQIKELEKMHYTDN